MGTRDDQDQVLLTVDEAAEFLNLSRATVYRLITKGTLEKVKIKGERGWKIPLHSLESYQIACSFTLQELAARLLSLERKVNFLLTSGAAENKKTARVGADLIELQRQIAKRHPNWLKSS